MDHNEILKHVKALYEYNQTSDKLKNELVIAFPELREFEDEDMIRYIGNAITCKESAKYLEEKGIDMIKAHRWLESFKPQLKQEWSEEDKKRVNRISDFIWKNRKGDTDEIYQQEQDVNWIKSLKDRYTWKPSEKQINALSDVLSIKDIKYDVLSELLKCLKKLK